MIKCEKCGTEYTAPQWPFCSGNPADHGTPASTAHAVVADSIPGGLRLENYGPEPVTVYSHTERKQIMAARGLELRERFTPTPGTDIDPAGIPNPKGYMDAVTLANGALLVARASKAADLDPVEAGIIANQFNVVLDTDEARALLEKVSC